MSAAVSSVCGCHLPSDYIGGGTLECDSEATTTVVFQSVIVSTKERNSSDLVEDLEKWVSTNPKLTVQGVELQVVGSASSSDKKTSGLGGVYAGTISAVVVVLLAASVIVVAVGCWVRRNKKSEDFGYDTFLSFFSPVLVCLHACHVCLSI